MTYRHGRSLYVRIFLVQAIAFALLWVLQARYGL